MSNPPKPKNDHKVGCAIGFAVLICLLMLATKGCKHEEPKKPKVPPAVASISV